MVTRRNRALLALLGATLLAGACSSLPDQPDEIRTVRNRAAQYTEYGDNYYRRGQYEQARSFYEIAYDLAGSVDSLGQIANLHNSLGRTWQAQGYPDDARREYEQARRVAARAGSGHIEAESIANLGSLAVGERNYGEAEALFHEALELVDGNRNYRRQEAIIRHNLGAAYAGGGRFEEARDQLERAKRINSELNRRVELASNHYMLASVASRSGEYDEALEHAKQALELDRSMENTRGIIASLRAIATISRRADRDEEAIEYLRRALTVARASDNRRASEVILDELVEVTEAIGHTEESARYGEILDEL